MVVVPLLLLGKLIELKLEEEDLTRRPGDESCLVDQEHLTKVLVIYFFVSGCVIIHFISHFMIYRLARNTVRLALPVERVNFVELRIIEAVLREIFGIAFYLKFCLLGYDSRDLVEEKVIVTQVEVVKQVDEQDFVIYKACGDERIGKVVDWHRVGA